MTRQPLDLTQALDLADHASPAPAEAAEALQTLRAEVLRLQIVAAFAGAAWISVRHQLPPLDVPVWIRAGTSCFVGARVIVEGDEWTWCDVGDRFWANPDGTWEAAIEVDGDTFEVESWLPLPPLSVQNEQQAEASDTSPVALPDAAHGGTTPEAFLLQHVKDGEAWEHHWFVPRWGDADPSSLHGRPIAIGGIERPELGTYRVKAFVSAESEQLVSEKVRAVLLGLLERGRHRTDGDLLTLLDRAEHMVRGDQDLIGMQRSLLRDIKDEAAPRAPVGVARYAVPTGEVSEGGHPTYTVHDEPVAMADNLTLYSPPLAAGVRVPARLAELSELASENWRIVPGRNSAGSVIGGPVHQFSNGASQTQLASFGCPRLLDDDLRDPAAIQAANANLAVECVAYVRELLASQPEHQPQGTHA